MADEKKESLEREEEIQVEKPKKKVQSEKQIQLSLDQYFEQYRPDVHKYSRAYVGAKYHGIIKTSNEWDNELKSENM